MTRDNDSKPYMVRYDAVKAMLLNKFLKEHRKNEEQQAIIERQQQQIEALTAGLQKVSAEIELNKTGTQTALNNQQAIRLRAASFARGRRFHRGNQTTSSAAGLV